MNRRIIRKKKVLPSATRSAPAAAKKKFDKAYSEPEESLDDFEDTKVEFGRAQVEPEDIQVTPLPRQPEQQSAQTTTVKADAYFDRVLKNIPADVIAAWLLMSNLIEGNDRGNSLIFWIVFAVFIIIVFFWTKKQTDQRGEPPAWTQIVVSTTAFVVWVFALGGPFQQLDFYDSFYGSLLLIIYTLIGPLIGE